MGELPDRMRQRLDEIFGEVFPAVTRDEAGDDGDRAVRAEDHDAALLADRPPHHDRG